MGRERNKILTWICLTSESCFCYSNSYPWWLEGCGFPQKIMDSCPWPSPPCPTSLVSALLTAFLGLLVSSPLFPVDHTTWLSSDPGLCQTWRRLFGIHRPFFKSYLVILHRFLFEAPSLPHSQFPGSWDGYVIQGWPMRVLTLPATLISLEGTCDKAEPIKCILGFLLEVISFPVGVAKLVTYKPRKLGGLPLLPSLDSLPNYELHEGEEFCLFCSPCPQNLE